MQMISFSGRQLLALIRESDFAHAGEEEAIDISLRSYPRRADQLLLDRGQAAERFVRLTCHAARTSSSGGR
jgi:hypothetical protein